MRKTRSIIAVCLTAALAFTGTAVPVQGDGVQKEAKAAVLEEVASGSGAGVASGAATAVTGDAASLKKAVDYFNSVSFNLNEKQKVRIQDYVLSEPEYQLAYYATNVLGKKNSNLKYGTALLDKVNHEELFVLAGKKLSIYNYDYEMMAPGFKAKPIGVVKNAKEVRVKGAKKPFFTVKTKKGKTVSYVTYKYGFDKIIKKTVYSVKGSTYKKGAKKISKKAFNKYVKSYKKQAPVKMEGTGMASLMTGYDYSYFTYMAKDFYVMDAWIFGVEEKPVEGWSVMRHDADDKENPYKAFGQATQKFRCVFGDEEKDWKAKRDLMFDVSFIIPAIKEALTGETMEVSINPYLSKKDDTVYCLSFKPVDGAEADYGYNVHIDESGANPIFKSVECMTSVGVVDEKYEFLYDSDAEVDGEMYEPGSDAECYADPDYVKAVGCKVRTLKVNVGGQIKEFKTTDTTRFVLDSSVGTFSCMVNGKPLNDVAAEPGDTALWKEYLKALNPENEDGTFGDPAITDLKWTANALK